MAEPESEEFRCENPECRVAESGKCVEGLQLQVCTHFGKVLVAETATPKGTPNILLPTAELIDIPHAAKIVRANDARVIAIIGPKGAGKTSLIAAAYDLLQEGPIDQYQFRRSHTLFAFERVCHDARAASRRRDAVAERTKVGQFGFYHLGLSGDFTLSPVDLLIADRSGEEYRWVADKTSEAKGFIEVKRADTIAMLVDGESLLDPSSRHTVRSDVQMILQGLIDGDAIDGQPLALVLTKLDKIQTSTEGERAQNDFEAFVKHVQKRYESRFSKITSFRIAASPITDILPRGYGVPEIVRYWVDTQLPIASVASPTFVPTRAMNRVKEIDMETVE